MKKFILFFMLVFFIAGLVKTNYVKAQTIETQATSTNSVCLTIKGKFTAKNWPGGKMMVACEGDAGPNCPGQIQSVGANTNFVLTKCSCPPYADGCLKIAKKLEMFTNSAGRKRVRVLNNTLPTSCTLTRNNRCGKNGSKITDNFKIICKAPASSPTPTPTVKSTPTPLPSGFKCPIPGKVSNIKVTCPNCTNATSTVDTSGLNAFSSPTPTVAGQALATPTPIVTPGITPETTVTVTVTPTP